MPSPSPSATRGHASRGAAAAVEKTAASGAKGGLREEERGGAVGRPSAGADGGGNAAEAKELRNELKAALRTIADLEERIMLNEHAEEVAARRSRADGDTRLPVSDLELALGVTAQSSSGSVEKQISMLKSELKRSRGAARLSDATCLSAEVHRACYCSRTFCFPYARSIA
eukprot:5098888-Pleurochrysis_carterae.AAC.1